jgi:hypothetical protein
MGQQKRKHSERKKYNFLPEQTHPFPDRKPFSASHSLMPFGNASKLSFVTSITINIISEVYFGIGNIGTSHFFCTGKRQKKKSLN